jgi:putative transposase
MHSTSRVERLKKEVKRGTDGVGIFPDDPSCIRLVGAVLMETAEEREVTGRY